MVVFLNLAKMIHVALKLSTVKGTDCTKKIYKLGNVWIEVSIKIEDIFHKLKFCALDGWNLVTGLSGSNHYAPKIFIFQESLG